jgi:hypothetical protein
MTTAIKTCFKCGEEKPLSHFYKHPRMKDGHVNKCKDCNKKDVVQNRLDNLDYYRQYDRERAKLDHRKELRARRKQLYLKNNPERYKANSAVNNAVRDGKIVKPEGCWFCGSQMGVVGHHSSYDRPLDVTWLCSSCHSRVHRETNQYKQAIHLDCPSEGV